LPKFLRTQLFPAVSGIKDLAGIKQWAEKLTTFLDSTFRKVADIPFNNSETIATADTGQPADTGDANSELTFVHHLGRTPAGFILTKSDAACSVYDSGTTWTTTTIYLKCNTANTAITILVY